MVKSSLSTQPALNLEPPSTQSVETNALAQALLLRLSISDKDWHSLKANPTARAREQVAAALVYLLNDQPDEAIARLQQSIGWLDRSISAPPCEHRTRQ
jgi:hypothetical protein